MYWMGFGGGWMMVFWFVIFVVGIVMFTRLFNTDRRSKSTESPLEILKRRYAEGSITKEEFEEKKNDIL